MAIPSLLGTYIDETYPRLLQVSGSEYADGLGNPVYITASYYSGSISNAIYAATASYYSGSISNAMTADSAISASYAVTSSYSLRAEYVDGGFF